MNRDNYIRLLEKENQEYFEKAIKQVKDCCCHEIPELNDEINELLDDLNDLQADWAADHAEERDRYRGIIRDLEEQSSNLKAAAVPKSKAPSYAPGYERKGGK